MSLTSAAEQTIEALARSLEVSEARYLSADRSYKSVCAWLEREGSRFADKSIHVYTQGSFRLGTAIRPVDEDEHYDLDIVCEFGRDKWDCTQAALHKDLGYELGLYAERHSMEAPSPWRRCWTLNYADEAQFHMDVLPSIPDGARQRELRKALSLTLDHVDQSISITDSQHRHYRTLSQEWPASNPNGYAEWFYDRMKPVFEALRKSMMLDEAKAEVADIPAFRVKTPLQSAIQILKHHRDQRFAKSADVKPASIVITTLAAHAYQQEATISGALFSILQRMDAHIERRGDAYWIPNPSDPRENFADHWNDEPERREAFYAWLEAARGDFYNAAVLSDSVQLTDALAPGLGRLLVEKAVAHTREQSSGVTGVLRTVGRSLQRILDASHRKAPEWPVVASGEVGIASAVAEQPGFRPTQFASDEPGIHRGSRLCFTARTNVERPYKVYWQIVNTGAAATDARNLRGGFDEVVVEAGKLTKNETAEYPGTHSIECFIVKQGYCVARSGVFIVNIV
ncbi:MAG: nucleotidyltransferase [Sphingomonadales bacterium]|nr:MAG: nucleotidyltransferase [Sphingomonadales bacterium]